MMDLTGRRFYRLTVTSEAPRKGRNKTRHWHCLCDCGQQTVANQSNLIGGRSKRCPNKGCTVRSEAQKREQRDKHLLYSRWKSMKVRCLNPNCASYKNYGGRGINICERWLDFKNYCEDLEPTFSPGLTLDRIDNNKGYNPDNCRWVTPHEQTLNKTNSVLLEYNGKMYNESTLAKATGVSRSAIQYRRLKGYSVEEMVEGRFSRTKEYLVNNTILNQRQLAEHLGITQSQISYQMLKKGKTLEEILNEFSPVQKPKP